MKECIVFLAILLAFSYGQEGDSRDPGEIIEKLRIYRLTKELDLTTEQAIVFFPKLNELQKIDGEFREQRRDILIHLEELLNVGAPDTDVMEALDTYEDLLKNRVDRQINKMGEIRKILTPRQQAKYLIFQDEFEREIKAMIREVKRLGPAEVP